MLFNMDGISSEPDDELMERGRQGGTIITRIAAVITMPLMRCPGAVLNEPCLGIVQEQQDGPDAHANAGGR